MKLSLSEDFTLVEEATNCDVPSVSILDAQDTQAENFNSIRSDWLEDCNSRGGDSQCSKDLSDKSTSTDQFVTLTRTTQTTEGYQLLEDETTLDYSELIDKRLENAKLYSKVGLTTLKDSMLQEIEVNTAASDLKLLEMGDLVEKLSNRFEALSWQNSKERSILQQRIDNLETENSSMREELENFQRTVQEKNHRGSKFLDEALPQFYSEVGMTNANLGRLIALLEENSGLLEQRLSKVEEGLVQLGTGEAEVVKQLHQEMVGLDTKLATEIQMMRKKLDSGKSSHAPCIESNAELISNDQRLQASWTKGESDCSSCTLFYYKCLPLSDCVHKWSVRVLEVPSNATVASGIGVALVKNNWPCGSSFIYRQNGMLEYEGAQRFWEDRNFASPYVKGSTVTFLLDLAGVGTLYASVDGGEKEELFSDMKDQSNFEEYPEAGFVPTAALVMGRDRIQFLGFETPSRDELQMSWEKSNPIYGEVNGLC